MMERRVSTRRKVSDLQKKDWKEKGVEAKEEDDRNDRLWNLLAGYGEIVRRMTTLWRSSIHP